MSLYKQNNLLDINNLFECQNNLKLKDNIFLDNDDINIEGGNIRIDNFYLSSYDSNRNVYIRGDKDGFLYVDALNSNIPPWLKTNINDVKLDTFNNDINATLKDEVHDIIYNSDFQLLKNIPKLSDIMIEGFGYLPIAIKESNLADIFPVVADTWYIDLEMNKYSLCNYSGNMEIDNIVIKNINFQYLQGTTGMLINGSNMLELSNNALNGKADVDIFGMCMLESNISSTMYLSKIYSDIVNEIENKLSFYNFNVNNVTTYLNDNLGDFYLSSNNLSDADTHELVNTLELDGLVDKVSLSNDEITFNDLNVGFLSGVNDLYVDNFKDLVLSKYPYYRNRYNSFVYIQMNENNYEVMDSRDIQYATENQPGQLKVLANLNSPHRVAAEFTTIRYEFMNDVNISELTRLRRSLDYINLDNILEIIYLENTALNTRLLRSVNNLIEMEGLSEIDRIEVFKNLQLADVVNSLEYDDLLRKPKDISSFTNDSGYIYNKNNLNDLKSTTESYMNLGIGDIGVYNTDNFNISGETLEMDYINILSNFSHILINEDLLDNDEICFIKSTSDGIFEIGHLPDTNDLSRGTVRMHNSLQYDEEGSYTINVLNDTYEDIHKKILDIRESIDYINNLI